VQQTVPLGTQPKFGQQTGNSGVQVSVQLPLMLLTVHSTPGGGGGDSGVEQVPFTQLWSDWQHALPHACVDGQQAPFTQLWSDWQHALPHACVDGQQAPFTQVSPLGQQTSLALVPLEHTVPPCIVHLRRSVLVRAWACSGNKGISTLPKRVAPSNLSALPRERVPLESPLASSSKECSSVMSS
jgi:hypothetical protein